MNSHILTGCRIVTPEWDDLGTVVIEDGVIAEILRGRHFSAGEDLAGQWLTPGCIDIHSDYLEREIRPRPSAEFPLPLAFHFMDQRAAACGLTTVMSAVSFSDKVEQGRSFESAIERARWLDRLTHESLVRHLLHARLDPNTNAVLDHLEDLAAIESLKLTVYNDSIPGQRQFRYEDLVRKRADSMGISETEARELLDGQIAERSAINHRGAIAEALVGRQILGSHDDTTVAHVDEAHAFSATLSEMPTTIEAARRARELGMWVCMGAPNYVRGGSHCGNLACKDAMAEDLVDIICSDYHFPSMHGAVVKMMADGISPSRCFDYVALNPARLLGMEAEVGSIEVGKQADLVAFRAEDAYTRVSRVWLAGDERFRSCLRSDLGAAEEAEPAALTSRVA
ncbi:MAG: alpha-D-ribose 1-methylphosphonate 5-triphosphate diphosphatase [Pseudomonadales bacterium]|jgi:alpha-D-ribose 1-methylphosphonate 5-triphosphate diphosphatase|nr:alpha-D-ribose 1-methylphosphonate 5-triphosphate diphosphatase [Pseudomonadales bacterium]